jgi:hypothetical protein
MNMDDLVVQALKIAHRNNGFSYGIETEYGRLCEKAIAIAEQKEKCIVHARTYVFYKGDNNLDYDPRDDEALFSNCIDAFAALDKLEKDK